MGVKLSTRCASLSGTSLFLRGEKRRPNQGLPLVGRPSFLSSSHISSATYLPASHGKELVERPELRSEA